jgi:hypothetical protein
LYHIISILGQVKLIPRITPRGAAQLSCDLAYFQSIFSALGVSTDYDSVLHAIISLLKHEVNDQVDFDASAVVKQVEGSVLRRVKEAMH